MEAQNHDILEWDGPAIGLLDLDAFFASVEQLDHPEWRGLPVIVGGSADHRGVVSTASYEARRYGVHSAMPSAQARRLCPNAIWTHGNFARYREVSAAVMDILCAETPLVEQVSIDEAFFDVTPGRYSRESPIAICQRVQERVARLGVSCSIGLGVNKTVAKIASERDKPRGLTVVFPGTESSFLAPLPVAAMSGIGPATERRLAAMGIHTLGELAKANDKGLANAFGVMGPRLRERASGAERSKVTERAKPDEVKSVSNERTFDHDLTTEDELRAAVLHIAAMTGRRLRRKGLAGSTVTLKLRYADLHARTAQKRLPAPTDDEHAFGPVAVSLLSGLWREGTPVRLVGVGISDFSGAQGQQLGLFDMADGGSAESHDGTALSKLTDALRDRFGNDAVSYGRDLRFKDHTTGTAPMGKNDA
ncbi:MAG: DNA polymerase IV [Olsenella sp.]|jgi:DNA polymerase-4|nr:DNA polymerase IV [Olsenella sp.]